LHRLPCSLGKCSIEILRNVVPNVLAIYDHGSRLLFDVRFTVLS
jgi:hypothetical protein